MNYKDYIKWERLPSTWCPGCAIGTVFKQLTFTLEKMAMPREELVVVSGIGCSGRTAGYFNVDSVHSTHGRNLPQRVLVRSAITPITGLITAAARPTTRNSVPACAAVNPNVSV